jgi:predicted ATPase
LSYPLRADGGLGGAVLTGLLERETEVASLGSLVRDAVAGRARLALVEAPAGIAKTRLLNEARRE